MVDSCLENHLQTLDEQWNATDQLHHRRIIVSIIMVVVVVAIIVVPAAVVIGWIGAEKGFAGSRLENSHHQNRRG